MEELFWISIGIVLYTYVGYAVLLYLLQKLAFENDICGIEDFVEVPTVALIIPAYNEEGFIEQKIKNSLALNYPKEKLEIYVVADGSTDNTAQLTRKYLPVKLLYNPDRLGKTHAMNRVMRLVRSKITIFTDANTLLNRDAVLEMTKRFIDPQVSAVSGEKRVLSDEIDDASSAGEGLYWRYESTLKRWDSKLNSTIGAAGELFAIRTLLYEEIPQDTVIEDFYLTMKTTINGFRIAYEPKAYAMEKASTSVREEFKRKIRICAGGFQAIRRMPQLLNFAKRPILAFQFLSHRVLRWTLAPLSLILIFTSSAFLALTSPLYQLVFAVQVLFYSGAIIGFKFEHIKTRYKFIFIPCYFTMMNWAAIKGFFRFAFGNQSVVWERATRKL